MTRKGVNKSKNEDRVVVNDIILNNEYYTVSIEEPNLLVAIADGVGGNNAGDKASSLAAEGIKELNKCKDIDEQAIVNVITEINNKIILESNKSPELFKMATTLSGIYIVGDNAWLFHIGNTRVYIMQSGYLKQLTEDQTTVNWLVKTGAITKEEAETHNRRNEITNCMGGGNEKLLEGLSVSEVLRVIENSRKIIITSDGVHEYVDIDELEKIICDTLSGQEICEKVVSEALKNGSQDDISVIVVMR